VTVLTHKTALALAVGATITLSQSAFAASGCEFSAQRMFGACKAEINAESREIGAKCAATEDPDERDECWEESRSVRDDGNEECLEQREARLDACEALGENRYLDPLVDDGIDFIDPDDIGEVAGIDNNPYVILQSGHTHMLRAESYDEEEDETSIEIIVVHATDEVREIQGRLCRVVVDIVTEPEFDEEEGKTEFEAVEVTDDWFAQDRDENVYYCGEVAQNFEDGVLRDLDGSFESGIDRAEAGYLIKAFPMSGDIHRQEYSLGEAEDIVEYVALDETPADEGIDQSEFLDPEFQCGDAGDGRCLMTYEYTPLEPNGAEYKYYLPGTGFVLAVPLEDGQVLDTEVEWLVCTGDELGIIAQDCGIEEEFGEGAAEELLETLCELSNELCDDGEDD
jgi:hypothetical protein